MKVTDPVADPAGGVVGHTAEAQVPPEPTGTGPTRVQLSVPVLLPVPVTVNLSVAVPGLMGAALVVVVNTGSDGT